MTLEESRTIPPGIYKVYWAMMGDTTTLAAIGIHVDGSRWLAPINWTFPITLNYINPDRYRDAWAAVLRLEPALPQEELAASH